MVSKEPVTERHSSDFQLHEQLEGLKQHVAGIDELLKISGTHLEEVGIEICSACGEAIVAGKPGKTKVVVHCAKSVP